MIETARFDAAEHLKSPEDVAAYLNAAIEEVMETGDPSFLSTAIDTAARAKGMAAIARETGLTREGIYKSFDGKTAPSFETVRKVLNALGVKLVVKAA
jgi:probable addiction module antidote protein